MKVLVVDDSIAIAEMIGTALEFADVDVDLVTSDFESLLAAERWQGVDAAVIDLMLPGMDGEDVVRYLEAEVPSVRRVVLSAVAHQRPGLAEHAICITKPVDPRQLLSALGIRDDC